MINKKAYKTIKTLLLISASLLMCESIHSQNLEVIGNAKITSMDSIDNGNKVVVRKPDGTLAERSSLLRVSETGDTLFNGTNWVIIPNISSVNSPNVVDFDGNSYETIVINGQVWMAENLKTVHFNNGTPIPKETDNNNWANLTTPAYCWYNNDSIGNFDTYGALYNFFAVSDTNTLNICPVGWDVPTDIEYSDLIAYLGGSSVAGGALKEQGTDHFNPPNIGATNSSGFTAVAGGNRNPNGVFDEFGSGAFFWSSTEDNANRAFYRQLGANTDDTFRFDNEKEIGFSVRCVKD